MSNFYYQGKIQQEHYLTQNDILLRSIYGKYELMIAESLLILFYAIVALVLYFVPIAIPYLIERILGSLLVGFGILNIIVYYFVIKKQYGRLMIAKAYLYLILGGILLIFPFSLQGFLYRIMASLFITIGIFTLIRRNQNGLYKKVVAIALILIGIFFIFVPEFDDYKDIIFFILVGIFGFYLLYNSIRFRRNLKGFEDEEAGFTNYTIK